MNEHTVRWKIKNTTNEQQVPTNTNKLFVSTGSLTKLETNLTMYKWSFV